jgi:hypothetical protein
MIVWYLSLDTNESPVAAAYPFVVPFLFIPALAVLLWQQRQLKEVIIR